MVIHQPSISCLSEKTINRWFFLFVCFHVVLWTVVPSIVRYHLPMDSIEGALWGHQLEWGYDKNPFMNAWLTAFAIKVGGYRDVFIYLLSQLAVATCFFATWQLAKRMVSPPLAFLSVILLEGIQYYHLHSIDLSDNLLELAAWSLTIYACYCAARGTKIAWVLTGLFAGLSMVTKYYSGFLLLSLAIFLVTEKSARRQLATRWPYIGLLVFGIVIAPHVVWLISNDFVTIDYMLTRTDSVDQWSNHFWFPAQFFYEQLVIALPTLILYASLFIGKGTPTRSVATSVFDKRFLCCAAFLPFVFTLLVSACFNLRLHAAWGSPLMTLWPLALFVFGQAPILSLKKIHAMIATVIILMFLIAAVYSYSLSHSTTPSSANFSGKILAETLTSEWHERYHVPLSYVAGSRFLVGSMNYYSPDHPSAWIDWDTKLSPWISVADVKKQGAIFIFYPKTVIPSAIQSQFSVKLPPELRKAEWLSNTHHLPPEEVQVIFVPPSP